MKSQILTIVLFLTASIIAIAGTKSLIIEDNFSNEAKLKISHSAASPAQTPNKKQTTEEQKIEERDLKQNGIKVETPEVYDDTMLQQMLRDTELKLAAMQMLDQSIITQRYGAVSGASQQISSFGLSVQGPSLPGVVTTDKGATSTTTDIDKITVNTSGQTSTDGSLQTVSGAATQDVQTSRGQINPQSISAPGATTSLPTSISVASSRILNEQMQLTAEIQMLRLLLRGSLSSHFIKPNPDGTANEMVKLKTTLGFPITITPDKRFKDAVAIVEVEVENQSDLQGSEKPMITALLPQEKTYNVAAITDKSTSIGGGLVTQVLGVSGSWLRGHKTYYLTQDQDTVALSFQPSDDNRKIGFRWQFRPVLGRRYIQDGLKRNFVQLAFPAPLDAVKGQVGKIYIRTYWREYDYKKGVVGEVIPNSLSKKVIDWDIPRYKLNTAPIAFSHKNLENLGGGQMMVNLFGRFLPGTYVRIGNVPLPISTDYYYLRFTAPINDLATKPVTLVAPDGMETVLVIKHPSDQVGVDLPKPPVSDEAGITTVDETNSKVTVELRDADIYLKERLVMIVGGRVFGYSTQRTGEYANLSAIVPTALLIDNPKVTVTSLLAPADWRSDAKIKAFDTFSRTERLVVLEQYKNKETNRVKFLLYGNRLKDIEIVNPDGLKVDSLPGGTQDDTLRVIDLTATQIQNNKYLVLQRRDERPFLIGIPDVEIKEKPVTPKPQERITVNSEDAVIEDVAFDAIEKIVYKGKEIKFEPTDDDKVRITGLVENKITTSATTKTLVFFLKSGAKPKMKLEVISSKDEIINKD